MKRTDGCLNRERLADLFEYRDGALWNKEYRNGRAIKGQRAGYVSSGNRQGYGYRVIRIDGRPYFEHRLVWIMLKGHPVPEQIDHINNNKTDNRIENLRAATHSLNQYSRPPGTTNSSGVAGVCFVKSHGDWQVSIGCNGRDIYLGRFKDKQQAIAARRAAELKYFGEYAHA